MTPSVMVMAIGTASDTMSVVVTLRMKKYSTNSDSVMPSRPAFSSSLSELVTPSPWLSRKNRLMPCISGDSPTSST